MIEYYYLRMYISSLAIQSVVEQMNSRISSELPVSGSYNPHGGDFAQDFKFIGEVREASSAILNTSIQLGQSGQLWICPARVILRIVSASIFLLKSISLGLSTDVRDGALDLLDRCNEVLQARKHDDTHLCVRYGMLIKRHLRKFRETISRGQPGFPGVGSLVTNIPSTPACSGIQRNQVQDGDDLDMSLGQGDFDMLNGFNFSAGFVDDWLSQPFDPSFGALGPETAFYALPSSSC